MCGTERSNGNQPPLCEIKYARYSLIPSGMPLDIYSRQREVLNYLSIVALKPGNLPRNLDDHPLLSLNGKDGRAVHIRKLV